MWEPVPGQGWGKSPAPSFTFPVLPRGVGCTQGETLGNLFAEMLFIDELPHANATMLVLWADNEGQNTSTTQQK